MPELPTSVVERMAAAKYELACPRCYNERGVVIGGMLDECPVCHGEHKNTATIALLEALTLALTSTDKPGVGG